MQTKAFYYALFLRSFHKMKIYYQNPTRCTFLVEAKEFTIFDFFLAIPIAQHLVMIII